MTRKKKTPPVERKLTVISFRCPERLVKALDKRVAELAQENPGGNWTRSSAAMNIVAKELL